MHAREPRGSHEHISFENNTNFTFGTDLIKLLDDCPFSRTRRHTYYNRVPPEHKTLSCEASMELSVDSWTWLLPPRPISINFLELFSQDLLQSNPNIYLTVLRADTRKCPFIKGGSACSGLLPLPAFVLHISSKPHPKASSARSPELSKRFCTTI